MPMRIPEGVLVRLRVKAIPALESNYIWMVHDDTNALLVDPGCAKAALAALAEHGLKLVGILITHHHHDHIGGLDEILKKHKVPVWGPDDDRIPQVTQTVHEGDQISIDALETHFHVIETPGHTRSHVVFYNDAFIFSGDTLFSLGCGRLFEGTAAQMLSSLDKVAKLHPDAQVCCGHEYTQANGHFAQLVDTHNPALAQRMESVSQLRAHGEPTLPVTLATELQTNPFLRTRDPSIIAAVRMHDPDASTTATDVFAILRGWKDQQS